VKVTGSTERLKHTAFLALPRSSDISYRLSTFVVGIYTHDHTDRIK